jgi:predicted metal-dependent hydrolase
MKDIIQIGDLSVYLIRKDIKNVHLSVHPPDGRVSLSAPLNTRPDVARAYAISKLQWIRSQQIKMSKQLREPLRKYIKRESHYIWGRRYLLNVVHTEGKQKVIIDHKYINLFVRPGASQEKREEVFYEWQKKQLHKFVAEMIAKWEPIMQVKVQSYFLQKMKTKWGSCNRKLGNIRLNTELVKKPKDLVEYVIVHELAHLIVPVHNEKFIQLLDKFYPQWRESRMELNELPLGYVEWK